MRKFCRQVCAENEVDILHGGLSRDQVYLFVSVQRGFIAARKRYWGCRFWWIEFRMNRSDSVVRILQMYLQGVKRLSALRPRAYLPLTIVVMPLDGRVLEYGDDALDLTVRPGVVWLGQAMRDAICSANHIERHGPGIDDVLVGGCSQNGMLLSLAPERYLRRKNPEREARLCGSCTVLLST